MKDDSLHARAICYELFSRSPSLELGTILRQLPTDFRGDGRLVEVKNAYAFGYANLLWSRRQAVRILFLANMESSQSHGSGNRASRRARALGFVSTEFGVGRFNERGELELAFGVHVSPKPKQVDHASIEEIAGFYNRRREIAGELGDYYERNTFTGD